MKKIFLVLSIFAIGLTLTACKDDEVLAPVCTSDQELVNGECVDKVVVPTCTADQTLVNNVCVDNEPECVPTIGLDGVLSNLHLRTALSYSIDRELITETMGAGQVPAGGFIPPGFLDHNGYDFFLVSGTYGLETDDTNYAEAVQLFALAAEEMGLTVAELQAELETLEILMNNGEDHQLIGQMIQEMWQDNLGFTMILGNEEWAVFQDTRTGGDFDITRGGWLTDFMDPIGMLGIFTSGNAYNDPNYYNDTFDELLSAAQATTDPQVHFENLYEAQELFMTEMPIIPIYHYTASMLVSDNLVNWGRSVLNIIDFSKAYMADGRTDFNWNIGAEPATLDPALNGASDGGDVINNTFEGLVREVDGVVYPGVAESWETSDDALTVTFHLRESLWSDGTPLTANDFVYSWLRAMNPATASEYSWIWEYTNVVGAADYAYCSDEVFDTDGNIIETACAAERAAVGIEAIDDYTLEVSLVNPTSYFVSLMAFFHFMPVKQSAVEAVGGEEGIWAKDPELVVSNGPFTLTAYTVGAELELTKNANYWNVDTVGLDTIAAAFNDSESSSYAAYLSGQFDYIPSVPSAEVPTLIAESDEFYVFPQLGTYYYTINIDRNDNGVNDKGTICP